MSLWIPIRSIGSIVSIVKRGKWAVRPGYGGQGATLTDEEVVARSVWEWDVASINVEFKVAYDARFLKLGKRLCTNEFDALGRMVFIWIFCTEQGMDFLDDETIDLIARVEGFADHMIYCGLGERGPGATVRIKGSERLGWLTDLRAGNAKGGQKRAENARREGGKFVASSNLNQRHQVTPAPLVGELVNHSPGHTSASAFTSSSASTFSKKEEGEKEKLHRDDIADAIRCWGNTLSQFGIRKDPKLDEVQIVRLIQLHGFQKARLALIGAAFEERSKTYDPAKHCSIRRLFKPENLEKFVNLGSQDQTAGSGGEIDISKIREAHANERR